MLVQADEVAFLPGGCGALAGAFRNYDMLTTPQRQQLLQARFLSPFPVGVPLQWGYCCRIMPIVNDTSNHSTASHIHARWPRLRLQNQA